MKLCSLITLMFFGFAVRSHAWGFWGHRMINKMACFTLPPELFSFYKKHVDFITLHAVDADKRRYSDPEEAPRHFIDLDRYGKDPFNVLPERWKEATEKFTADTLKSNGIVPWYIHEMFYKLRKAFTEKDISKIIYYSAMLGHYVGDAHVPLHCTENYNGQLTGQNGIHGFWESRLPELFGDDYDYFVGNAEYIDDISSFSWKIVKNSYAALDTVLSFERELNSKFPADQKYSFEVRGTLPVKVYSNDYSERFHEALAGQVERRIRAAIIAVGSIWYTAWADAGMPDLSGDAIIAPFPEDTMKTNGDVPPNAKICD
jgi:hypothetical protein